MILNILAGLFILFWALMFGAVFINMDKLRNRESKELE